MRSTLSPYFYITTTGNYPPVGFRTADEILEVGAAPKRRDIGVDGALN